MGGGVGLTRKETAGLLGVGAATLLYYERRGMISPSRSEGNGYRLYAKAEIDRLALILKAKDLGLSLREISELFAGIEAGESMKRLREGIGGKIAAIRLQIAELERRAQALEELSASPNLGACETIRAVAAAAGDAAGDAAGEAAGKDADSA
jgi:DNA-binding transcriptional MerR regulator